MISPPTMRPGGSTMRRIDCAVTLFPQPLSPTMPSVLPGITSKVVPSTALVVPSSWKKLVRRSRTERSGTGSIATILEVRVRGVADTVAHEVEGEHRDNDGEGGNEQPRRDDQRLDVLRVLQQHAPADRRRPQSQPEERERRLADDDRGDGERRRGDDVAYERWHHVTEDDACLAATHELGGHHEILMLERNEPAANHPGELRPAD